MLTVAKNHLGMQDKKDLMIKKEDHLKFHI
jgi:hypothetical protein